MKSTPKPINPKLLSVTIREIEHSGPCSGKYFEFLKEIASNCVLDGVYAEIPYRRFPKPRYGPDDPIPLRLIAYSGDGTYRVTWLINHLDRLRPLKTRAESLRAKATAVFEQGDMDLLRQIEVLNKKRVQLQAKADNRDSMELLIAELPSVAAPKPTKKKKAGR